MTYDLEAKTKSLPRNLVYIVIDCASSPHNQGIIATHIALGTIHLELIKVWNFVDYVHISSICFGERVEHYPLTTIDKWIPPFIHVQKEERALGAALRLVLGAIEQDIILNQPGRIDDHRPIVFLCLSGVPTDDYQTPLAKLKALQDNKQPQIVTVNCGDEFIGHVLHTITDTVFTVEMLAAQTLKDILKNGQNRAGSAIYVAPTSSRELSRQHIRRLPVYLLLDCSSSMKGAPIASVNEGLGIIYRELMNDPQAVQTVHLSIIRFADRADQDALVDITQFVPPTLSAYGATAMGAAINVLVDSIEQDLVQNDANRNIRGDYRPIVFLITNGEPTDDFRNPLQRLKALRSNLKPTIVALACGQGANTAMLYEVTDSVFQMHAVSPETLKKYFKWFSASVTTESRAANDTMMSPTTIPGIEYSPWD